jgi:hypothetical protein
MGVVKGVGITEFPKQGQFLNKRVEVCFNHDTSKIILGVMVRNDIENPGEDIIKLDDGRYIRSTECQYHPIL